MSADNIVEVRLDGEPQARMPERELLAWAHRKFPYSLDHVTKHEGWSVHPIASAVVLRLREDAWQVACPEHPQFVRVAWRRLTVPMESAVKHNAEHHGGADVVIVGAPDAQLRSLIPGDS